MNFEDGPGHTIKNRSKSWQAAKFHPCSNPIKRKLNQLRIKVRVMIIYVCNIKDILIPSARDLFHFHYPSQRHTNYEQ
jgi:hypothetical protein